jgi:hypothetical protein
MGLFWLLVPWLDKGRSRAVKVIVRAVGTLFLLFMIVMTILGYTLT